MGTLVWKGAQILSNMAFDSKPRLAGSAGTSVPRNRFSVEPRISDWITEIFDTSYKISKTEQIGKFH